MRLEQGRLRLAVLELALVAVVCYYCIFRGCDVVDFKSILVRREVSQQESKPKKHTDSLRKPRAARFHLSAHDYEFFLSHSFSEEDEDLDSKKEEEEEDIEYREPWSYQSTVKGQENETCTPMRQWQVSYFPTCNSIHEMDLSQELIDSRHRRNGAGQGMDFLSQGGIMTAWKVHDYEAEGRASFLMKTFRLDKARKYNQVQLEKQRIDAMMMERRSSSPYIFDIYGTCALSQVSELADGGSFDDQYAKTTHLYPRRALRYAIDMSQSIAELHHGNEEDGAATLVHGDVGECNFLFSKGIVKLNDFNEGFFMRRNTARNTTCGFPKVKDYFGTESHRRVDLRAPEELLNHPLTEKIDIYGIGAVLYYLLTKNRPYHCEPFGVCTTNSTLSDVEMLKRKVAGDRPTLPKKVAQSTIPEIVALRDAMHRSLDPTPEHRPSAKEIADALKRAL